MRNIDKKQRLQEVESDILRLASQIQELVKEIIDDQLYEAEGFESFAEYLEARPQIAACLPVQSWPKELRLQIEEALPNMSNRRVAALLGVNKSTVDKDRQRSSPAVAAEKSAALRVAEPDERAPAQESDYTPLGLCHKRLSRLEDNLLAVAAVTEHLDYDARQLLLQQFPEEFFRKLREDLDRIETALRQPNKVLRAIGQRRNGK